MCWSASVALGFAAAEAVVLLYVWCRNAHHDRNNVLIILPLTLQELGQALLWPYVVADRDYTLGFADPALHSCPRANKAYSYLIAAVVCGLPPWFEFHARREFREHNALLESGTAPAWRKLVGELPTPNPEYPFQGTFCAFLQYVLILGVLGCSLVLGTWGPASCTTKGPHGHQVWAMMVWPNKFAEVAAAFVYFGTAGAFKWVPRPSLFTPLLMGPVAIWAIVAYLIMGPEAGSVWCWTASLLCAVLLVEPAVIDSARHRRARDGRLSKRDVARGEGAARAAAESPAELRHVQRDVGGDDDPGAGGRSAAVAGAECRRVA